LLLVATFKSQLRNACAKMKLITPTKGSSTTTIATTEAVDKATKDLFNARFADNFNSIN
jgi:hypothetical protein